MEKKVSSKLLHKGKHFSFKTDTVQLDNGKETIRDIVDHPGAIAVIPVDGESIIMVRQFRYAAGKELLEIPAGTLEPGEDSFACAVRELQEETGYAASEWNKLLSCYMAPGYSNEIIHFYVAEGLNAVDSNPEDDESITVEKHSFNDVLTMIEENVIEDSKTITGVLGYLTRPSL
ncbi:MAG: NUDIX hydrolase [Candidatus Bathyarchaeota archaeon]|nr:NUDIX hydrolase [Candidatus Bathyarchaeota archaeon]